MRIVLKLIFIVFSFFIVAGFSFVLIRYQSNRPLQSVVANSTFSQHAVSIYSDEYLQLYNQYGLNNPPLYFSTSNLALPDSFNYFPASDEKDFLIYWSCKTGAPSKVYPVYKSLFAIHNEDWLIPPSQVLNIQHNAQQLVLCRSEKQIDLYFKKYLEILPVNSKSFILLNGIKDLQTDNSLLQFIPTLHFNRLNQFATWLNDLFKNADGIYAHSWYSKNNAIDDLVKPFKITAMMAIVSWLIIILFSIIISCELFLLRRKLFVKYVLGLFSFVYSLPSFFIGAILILIFANPYFLQLFPANFSFAPISSDDGSILLNAIHSFSYFILPVITLSIGAVVFFVLLYVRSFEEESNKNYVMSARMMGVSDRTIIYKYILKNSFYSSSTFLFLLLPALLSGSLITEQIFSVPGLGSLLMTAARNQDVPVLILLFGLTGIITTLSFFALDSFQQKINARVLTKTASEK